jgi:hypothetical protein
MTLADLIRASLALNERQFGSVFGPADLDISADGLPRTHHVYYNDGSQEIDESNAVQLENGDLYIPPRGLK